MPELSIIMQTLNEAGDGEVGRLPSQPPARNRLAPAA